MSEGKKSSAHSDYNKIFLKEYHNIFLEYRPIYIPNDMKEYKNVSFFYRPQDRFNRRKISINFSLESQQLYIVHVQTTTKKSIEKREKKQVVIDYLSIGHCPIESF